MSATASASRPPRARYAYVTLLTTDAYLPGALALSHSIRANSLFPSAKDAAPAAPGGSSSSLAAQQPPAAIEQELVVLVTPATVGVSAIKTLGSAYDRVIGVEPLGWESLLRAELRRNKKGSREEQRKGRREVRRRWKESLQLLGRPDLASAKGAPLTKLHAWRLDEYEKVIFLDADTLVLRSISHLFRNASAFAAAPDIGWPDAFNSGVMVLTPSQGSFEDLRRFAVSQGSWDGADQGLLNDFFGGERGSGEEGQGGGWDRLSFRYNVTPSGGYTYAPAFQRYGAGMYVAHFIGAVKPWRHSRPHPASVSPSSSTANDYATLLRRWHDAYEAFLASDLSGQVRRGVAQAQKRRSVRVRVVHTQSGVEIVEEEAFEVPTLEAAWTRSADAAGSAGGAGRVEELKGMFVSGSSAGTTPSGTNYSALPLDGRISLMPPEPDAELDRDSEAEEEEQRQRAVERAKQEQEALSRSMQAEPSMPPMDSSAVVNRWEGSGTWSPPKVSWDPANGPPPSGTGVEAYQMRAPPNDFFENAWDRQGGAQGGFFKPQPDQRQEESRRQTMERLRAEQGWDRLGGERPDPSKIKPIFPWEEAASSAAAGPSVRRAKARPTSRIFPEDDLGSASPSPNVSGGEAAQNVRRGLPLNLSLNYTNAWDELEPIARYGRQIRDVGARGGSQHSASEYSSTSRQGNSRGVQARPGLSAVGIQTAAQGGGGIGGSKLGLHSSGSAESAASSSAGSGGRGSALGRSSPTKDRRQARSSRIGEGEGSALTLLNVPSLAGGIGSGEDVDGSSVAHQSEDGDDESSGAEGEGDDNPSEMRETRGDQQREGKGYQRRSLELARSQNKTQPRSPRNASGSISSVGSGSSVHGHSANRSGSRSRSSSAASSLNAHGASGAAYPMRSSRYPGGSSAMRAYAHLPQREGSGGSYHLREGSEGSAGSSSPTYPIPAGAAYHHAYHQYGSASSMGAINSPLSRSPANSRAELAQIARAHAQAQQGYSASTGRYGGAPQGERGDGFDMGWRGGRGDL